MNTLTRTAIAAGALTAALGVQAGPVPGQGTWATTLQPRDINGDTVVDAYYDTALKLTWLANANANGLMNWTAAMSWAASLDVYGVTGWRLPTVTPVNGTSFNYDFSNNGTVDYGYAKTGVGWGTASELGHLFYVTLGNLGYCTPNNASPAACSLQSGWGLSNTGPFRNLQSGIYWSATEYAPFSSIVSWRFGAGDGNQGGEFKVDGFYAVAVRPGDVAVVPEPQALALALVGLGVVAVVRRRRRA